MSEAGATLPARQASALTSRADSLFIVVTLQTEQSEFLPCRQIFLANQFFVDVFVVIHRVFGNLDLRVRTGDEVHVFAGRQCYDEFFDESGHVLVRDNLAFPFFHAEYAFGHLDFHVILHLHLASQPPVVLNLFAAEVRCFRRQNLAAACQHLAFALSARTLAAAGRRKEHSVYGQRVEQGRTGSHFQHFVAVDGYFYVSRRYQEAFGHQQNDYQQEHHYKEYSDTR